MGQAQGGHLAKSAGGRSSPGRPPPARRPRPGPWPRHAAAQVGVVGVGQPHRLAPSAPPAGCGRPPRPGVGGLGPHDQQEAADGLAFDHHPCSSGPLRRSGAGRGGPAARSVAVRSSGAPISRCGSRVGADTEPRPRNAPRAKQAAASRGGPAAGHPEAEPAGLVEDAAVGQHPLHLVGQDQLVAGPRGEGAGLRTRKSGRTP